MRYVALISCYGHFGTRNKEPPVFSPSLCFALMQTHQTKKAQLVRALQTHQVNTLEGLRRIERIFASIGTPDVTGPMTSACKYAPFCFGSDPWRVTKTQLLILNRGLLRQLQHVTDGIARIDPELPFQVNKSPAHSPPFHLRQPTFSSSQCLSDAKQRVYTDPSSNRSWNFCWLVLTKIQTE
jgi:hypothetical protein